MQGTCVGEFNAVLNVSKDCHTWKPRWRYDM